MKTDIIQHLEDAKTLDNSLDQIRYLSQHKNEIIEYAEQEPFIIEEYLKELPDEITIKVWSGYKKRLNKVITHIEQVLF